MIRLLRSFLALIFLSGLWALPAQGVILTASKPCKTKLETALGICVREYSVDLESCDGIEKAPEEGELTCSQEAEHDFMVCQKKAVNLYKLCRQLGGSITN